jgi:hypothetical protein
MAVTQVVVDVDAGIDVKRGIALVERSLGTCFLRPDTVVVLHEIRIEVLETDPGQQSQALKREWISD